MDKLDQYTPIAPATVPLRRPVLDFGKEVREVTISREANGSDLRATAGLTDEERTLVFVERLCGLTRQAVDSLLLADISRIDAAMLPFVKGA